MNDIKLVAFDLDGTTLSMCGTVASQRFCDCVQQGIRHGVIFAPFTGRSLTTVPKQITDIPGLRYISYSNGAGIYDTLTQRCIYNELMELDVCLELLHYLDRYDLLVFVISDGKIVLERHVYDNCENYPFSPHHLASIADGTTMVVDNMKQYFLEHKPNVDKLNIVEVLGEDREKIFAHLAKSDKVYGVSSGGTNLEINAINTNKGNAIRFLAEHLGIDLQNVMALGDNDNDVEMLEVAGLGVAVENASDAAKAVANYITDAQDMDGAAKAIEHFIFNDCTVSI